MRGVCTVCPRTGIIPSNEPQYTHTHARAHAIASTAPLPGAARSTTSCPPFHLSFLLGIEKGLGAVCITIEQLPHTPNPRYLPLGATPPPRSPHHRFSWNTHSQPWKQFSFSLSMEGPPCDGGSDAVYTHPTHSASDRR